MKNLKVVVLALLAVFSLTSCGEGQKKEQEASMPMQEETLAADESEQNQNLDDGEETANAEFEDKELAAVYENYLGLKSALVNTNAEEAQNEAQKLSEALQRIEDKDTALNAAETIAASSDINVQRTAFSDLSAAVESLVAGNLTSGAVYKQYCPMAFDGAGGYWLSSSEEVRNPYYGDMMLKCGRVDATIQ